MKLILSALVFALAAPAFAGNLPPPPPPPQQDEDVDVQPPAPPPSGQPAAPLPANPPPRASEAQQGYAAPAAPPSAGPAGEWVYTRQYGWVWMPYEQRYTQVTGTVAYSYVFYPGYGWRWLSAPWIVGIGPRPYFAHGPARFVWYSRPWFRVHPVARRRIYRHHRH